MATIEQEELEQLKLNHSQVRDLRNALADAQIAIYNAKLDRDSCLKQLELSSIALRTIQEELYAKYGDITVNFATGEITPKQDAAN